MSKDDMLIVPAWPLVEVIDPTGAGDTFAGGLLGTLAALGGVTRENLHKALVNATVTAAYTCEAFSVDRLRQITRAELEERALAFRRMLP